MSFNWSEFGQTLRDDTFATWFGWFICLSVVIGLGGGVVSSCWSESAQENIEIARLDHADGQKQAAVQAQQVRDQDLYILQIDTLKWMTTRGVHPLVARCAIQGNPAHQCNTLIGDLKEEERATIQAILADPFTEEATGTAAVAGLKPRPGSPQDLTAGYDFGGQSAVQN